MRRVPDPWRTPDAGFEVAQSTVSKYMMRGGAPPSQSWKTFLRNHTQAIAAIDLCVVPTLTFERLFAFLVLPFKPRAVEQQRRTQERRSISIPPHLRAEGTRWPPSRSVPRKPDFRNGLPCKAE